MKQKTLTEEKGELIFKLLNIVAEREKQSAYTINILDVIPIIRGLKVVYTIGINNPKKFSRVIKYSDLANEDWDIPNAKDYRGETWIGLEDEIEELKPWFIII